MTLHVTLSTDWLREIWGRGMWEKITKFTTPTLTRCVPLRPTSDSVGSKKNPTPNWIFSCRTWNFLELQIWLLEITYAHLTPNFKYFLRLQMQQPQVTPPPSPNLPFTSNLEHFLGLQIWLPQIKLRSPLPPPQNGTFHGELRHCRDFNWKDIVSLQYISLKLNIALMNPGISLVIC